MKKKTNMVLCSGAAMITTCVMAGAADPVPPVRFPVGFWNYCQIADQDVSAVKDWADAGMTLAIGPYFGPEAAETAKMRTILDAAQEKGIRVILADRRALWTNLTNKGEKAYRAECQAAVKELGDHPAVFGYYVGDEPNAAAFPDACKAMRIQKELAPRLSPFLNLLPWFRGAEKVVGFPTWTEYLNAYGRQAAPDFLCYDCYAQCRPNPDTDGYSFEQYFRDLYEYREAARRQNIPFWTTILSVGHFDYRCPTEDLFRWQINTAIAHGAKGILYFYFYNNVPPHAHENYRLAPIDEHGERTETYSWMSRVNRTFLRSVAPLAQDMTVRQVWHVGKAWGGFPLFNDKTATNRVMHVAAPVPLVVSECAKSDGSDYVMVVNMSQERAAQSDLTVRGRAPTLYLALLDGKEMRVGESVKAKGADRVQVLSWLAPGQMALYRVEDTGK
jgi:hypothetical protein